MRSPGVFLLPVVLLFLSIAAVGQQKPWTEWTKKEAEKILNDSPWGQTQADTNTSELFFSPTANDTISPQDTTGSNRLGTVAPSSGRAATDRTSKDRQESGAKNQALGVTYRVRFFSAKPIRAAFARLLTLQDANVALDEVRRSELLKTMQAWVDVDVGDNVVLAVSIEATDRRLSGPVEQAFLSATSDTLKNTCYLELKDGTKIYVTRYQAPTADQTGAKFVFPRTVNGKSLLTQDSGVVRFVAEFGGTVKINRKYKVSEMVYDGQLVY